MNNYLGEKKCNLKDTPFKDYSTDDWINYFVDSYGDIDGSHHQQWVDNQVLRLEHGGIPSVSLAQWGTKDNIEHEEWRISEVPKTESYLDFLKECDIEDNDEDFEGIAP